MADYYSWTVTPSYQDAADELVTSVGPNSTPSNSSAQVSLSTSDIGLSWSFPTDSVTWDNGSNSSDASWDMSFAYRTNSTYDGEPGWQMSNTAGDLVYTRSLTATWYNWLLLGATNPQTFSNQIALTDF